MSVVAGTPVIDSPKASEMMGCPSRVACTITARRPQSSIRSVIVSRISSATASVPGALLDAEGDVDVSSVGGPKVHADSARMVVTSTPTVDNIRARHIRRRYQVTATALLTTRARDVRASRAIGINSYRLRRVSCAQIAISTRLRAPSLVIRLAT